MTPEQEFMEAREAKLIERITGGRMIRPITINICDDCLNLKGEMCHNPECVFCRRTMAEVGEYLDVLMILPIVNRVRLTLVDVIDVIDSKSLRFHGPSGDAVLAIDELIRRRSQSVTDADLKELAELHAKANKTPGPVKACGAAIQDSDGRQFALFYRDLCELTEQEIADAELYVAMRNRLPAILERMSDEANTIACDLRVKLDSAQAELERWRHGATIEGDFVCPNALKASNLEAENAELKKALATAESQRVNAGE